MSEVFRWGIAWGPSIAFILCMLGGFLLGMLRGFRKSVILGIQAIIAGLICLITYLCIINMKGLDTWGFNCINSILSIGGTNLQKIMNVSSSCKSLKDVLIEFIPKQMSLGDGLSLVLTDNGAYLATLVDICYHIIFALVFYIFYFFLVFIFYFVYLIFYSEGKYKRKQKEKYRTAKTTQNYKKHFLLGGAVGALRSAVVGVIGLSFVGILLFILAGGIGDKKYKEYETYDFGDDKLNLTYDFYKALGSYGSTGIYKILNVAKDSDNIPYYLFAANLVFQGGLKDDNRQIKENVILSKEFGIYINFSRKTFDLILKYDADNQIKESIKNATNSSMSDIVFDIMSKEDFQKEFNLLIDEFEGGTYFINFGLSLIDSIVLHLDEISSSGSMNQQTKDILTILFKSEQRITPSILLNKNDVKSLVKACIKMLAPSDTETKNLSNEEKTIKYGKVLLPEISKLSLFENQDLKNKINPVLSNLYNYFAEALLNKEEESETIDVASKAMKLTNTTIDEVDWLAEIKVLLGVGEDALNLYERIYSKDKEILDIIFDDLFFGDNAEENEIAYDNITKAVADSKFFGVVLSMNFISSKVETAVSSQVPNFKFLPMVQYTNQYNVDGSIKEYGEIYNLLNITKLLIKNGAKDAIQGLNKEDSSNQDKLDAVNDIMELLQKNDVSSQKSILDLMLESKLFTYTLSNILMNVDLGGDMYKIYVPEECLYTMKVYEDVSYKAIETQELKGLITEMSDFIDILKPAIKDDMDKMELNSILNHPRLKVVLENSRILEGTASYIALANLKDQEKFTIPKSISTADSWLSTEDKKGELISIIDAVQELDLDIDALIANQDSNELMDIVFDLNDPAVNNPDITKLDCLYESNVLKSAITAGLDEQLKSIVSQEKLESSFLKDSLSTIDAETDEVIVEYYFKKEEISNIIYSLKELDITELTEEGFNRDVLKDKVLILRDDSLKNPGISKLEVIYDSYIIKLTLKDLLDEQLIQFISEEIINCSLVKETESVFDKRLNQMVEETFYKKSELSAIIDSLHELDITSFNSSSFNEEVMKNKVFVVNEISENNPELSKLDILYKSIIIRNAFTKPLDTTLTNDSTKVNPIVLDDAKSNKDQENLTTTYYKKEEIKRLANALSEQGLGIENLDQISQLDYAEKIKEFNQIPEGYEKTRLNVIYESNILKNVLSIQLDDILNSNENIINDPDAKYSFISNDILFYFEEELSVIIDFLNLLNSSNSLNELNVSSLNLTEEMKECILDSKILYATTSKFIIENENLIKPNRTILTTEHSIKKIKEPQEMSNLLSAIISLSGGNVSADVDLSLSEEKIDMIVSSSILRATISDEVMNNEYIITPNKEEVIDPIFEDIHVLTEEELQHLLLSVLNGLGITDVASFNADLLIIPSEEENVTALVNSIIMRATISKNIKSTDGSLTMMVENNSKYVSFEYDISNDSIIILTEQEIRDVINSIQYINNGTTFEIELSTEKLLELASDINKMYEAFESSVVKLLITDFLQKNEINIAGNKIGYTSAVTPIHMASNPTINTTGEITIEGHDSYQLEARDSNYYFHVQMGEVVTIEDVDLVQYMTLTSDDLAAYLLYIKGFSTI